MEQTNTGNITNLDPQLRDRLEYIVTLLAIEIDVLIDDEADADKNAALIAMSDAVVVLENYLYPELKGWKTVET
ncbi:hypothetical protein EB001_02675 [bacterium]|nr:hypothetical protein [bacterium]